MTSERPLNKDVKDLVLSFSLFFSLFSGWHKWPFRKTSKFYSEKEEKESAPGLESRSQGWEVDKWDCSYYIKSDHIRYVLFHSSWGNIQNLRQRKMEKNGKTCSKTEPDSDTEVKVSLLQMYLLSKYILK